MYLSEVGTLKCNNPIHLEKIVYDLSLIVVHTIVVRKLLKEKTA